MNKRTIEQKTSSYRAWLHRANHDRPLVGVLWEPDIPPLPEILEKVGMGRELRPEDVDPAMYLPFIEQCYQLDQSLPSDGIQPFSPAFGIPWMEAIAGCPAVCQVGSIWAHPCLEDLSSPPRLEFDPDNAWFRALAGFTCALVEFADGRFPVALPQMRGPLDILAAMRGPERMCIDLIEQPEQVQAILDRMALLWIDVASALLSLIPPFTGGYCSRMKMWAPGPVITPQNDASSLISPRAYRAFLSENDRRIFEAFPFSCFHMHSTEYRHIPTLLDQPALTCIEFTLEHQHGGLPLEPSLTAARAILGSKPLVLAAPDPASADICRNSLPSEGLCLLLAANEPTLPEPWVEWVRRSV